MCEYWFVGEIVYGLDIVYRGVVLVVDFYCLVVYV